PASRIQPLPMGLAGPPRLTPRHPLGLRPRTHGDARHPLLRTRRLSPLIPPPGHDERRLDTRLPPRSHPLPRSTPHPDHRHGRRHRGIHLVQLLPRRTRRPRLAQHPLRQTPGQPVLRDPRPRTPTTSRLGPRRALHRRRWTRHGLLARPPTHTTLLLLPPS